MRSLAASFLVATLLAGCGSAARVPAPTDLWSGPSPTTKAMSPADAAAIDAAGEQIITTMGDDLPGMWIGVWDSQKGYHLGAYGRAALPGTAATVNDHSRIGSVSKTFTTATIMRLVDQGRLTMEATIEKVLPDLAKQHPPLAAVTVRQLIDMTSGIADYVNSGAIFPALLADPTKAWNPAEIIDLSQTLENAEPGTPGYTSTATIILGEMITAVSGRSVAEAVGQIAHDAGLTQTALPNTGDATMPAPAARGYIFEPGVNSLKEVGVTVTAGSDVSDWSPSWGGAAGGMYSTPSDLGKWAGTGFGATLLSKKLGAERLGGPTTTGGGDTYGLGLTHWGQDWVGHTGQIIGWESFAAYNVKSGEVVVVLVNETGSLPGVLPGLLQAANPALGETLSAR